MRRIQIASFLFASIALAACGPGNNNNNNGSDGGTDPLSCEGVTETATADQVFTQVIDTQCKSCHNSGLSNTSNGGLHMATVDELKAAVNKASGYAGTTGTLKVVEPDHPENSTMFLKVLGGSPEFKGPNGQSVGGRMPQGGTLPDADVQLIKQWICNGA